MKVKGKLIINIKKSKDNIPLDDIEHKTVDEIMNYINEDKIVKNKKKKKSRKNRKAKKEEPIINEKTIEIYNNINKNKKPIYLRTKEILENKEKNLENLNSKIKKEKLDINKLNKSMDKININDNNIDEYIVNNEIKNKKMTKKQMVEYYFVNIFFLFFVLFPDLNIENMNYFQ